VIIDSSALLAIVREEPEVRQFVSLIYDAPVCRVSAGTLLETMIVADARSDAVGRRRLDEFLAAAKIMVEPVTEEQARIGREAYRDFGKGSGHPAQLNFGDCFAYALAKQAGEPLLFKGRDFSFTDVRSAI
jgi:ribonuclease VapC